ncbi:MAG: right-handed parallel beta-helix repeat-containing protein [Chloroflexi bacterium]|nr:right-handed parallel beta-helix repeat-containing protein [Chloroflexota bacterium]
MKVNVVPENGMVVTESTRLAPGVYVLPNGLSIGADGVTLEGEDTQIISGAKTGAGISVQGHSNVTVRGLYLSGYYHAVRADACRDLVIENVTVRNTAEVDGITTFVYLWKTLDWLEVEKAYGGAILLNNVQGGAVRGCDLQHQMNGLMMYRCSGLMVEDNNASFNSGWGVYLHDSSDNVVQDNQIDFCNRVYRRPEDGSVRVEADAAAIVLVINSSRNKVLRNSCLCGGDGIFVAGYYHPGGVTPCNDNLFEDNDCRLSPNNAIESTFSKGNVFRRNNCSRSNYGFWMGYSWDNVLEDNIIEFNRFVGIAAEHAYDFTIRNNSIRLNGEGIRLWTRGGEVLPHWPGHEVPYNFDIEDNMIESNGLGFDGTTGDESPDAQSHNFRLRGNTFRDNRVGARFGRARDCTVEGNTFAANVEAALLLVGDPGVAVGQNTFDDNARDIEKR